MAADLREEKVFLLYKVSGDGKKIPVGLNGEHGLEKASTGTLSEAKEALATRERENGGGGLQMGVGISFGESLSLVFIDIDDYDPRLVMQSSLLRAFADRAYIETSLSGQGYHIIACAREMGHLKSIKAKKFEIYFKGRFCALTEKETSQSIGLARVRESDCTRLAQKIYHAASFLLSSTPLDVLSKLQRGVAETYDSSSEYDFALAQTLMKHTLDRDVIHGVMILSESDELRVRLGKKPKVLDREDYVLATIDSISKEWNKFLVTEAFDLEAYERDNLISLFYKPVIRRHAFTVIRSLTGVGKGHFALSIVMSLLSGSQHTLGATCKDGDYSFLYCDTEMGKDLTAKMRDMCLKKAPANQTHRMVFASVKEASIGERLSALSRLAQQYKPDVVIVDGFRDLVHNFNDTSQVYALVQELEALCASGNCAVIGTIHLNLGQDPPKSRGHLGSELEQKAFGVIQIDRDGQSDTLTVRHVKSRVSSRLFKPYKIMFDEELNCLVEANDELLEL